VTDTPWEPPLSGGEKEHLLGALDRLRWTFRWKADGLSAEGLAARLGPSKLTLGSLLKHLATQEDYASTHKLNGAPMPSVWDANGWDDDADWELSSAATDSPELLYALYDGAVARSREAWASFLERGGLDQQVHMAEVAGEPVNARRVLCDLVEEYGRHTGHADLLRESVDGRVGEDPEPDWRPSPDW
jgi:Protein of unknown function (DUF664)